MDTSLPLIVTLIVLFSFQYIATDDNDSYELIKEIKEKCEEASIPEAHAKCYPDRGRIYVFDPEVKLFDDARRWCRQKFGGHRSADLLSIETCDDWYRTPNLVENFLETKQSTGSTEYIWTQIISGPRIVNGSSIPEIVMEHLNSEIQLPSKEIQDLRSTCLKNVTEESIKKVNVLVLLANGLSVTPKLVYRTADAKGHALCEFRFKPGLIEIPPEPATEPPPTEAPTSIKPIVDPASSESDEDIKQNETSQPADNIRKSVDRFFVKIEDEIDQNSQTTHEVAETVVTQLKEDNFILTTQEHINKTVGLVRHLKDKFEREMSKVQNKTVVVSERLTFTQQVCTILSALMEDKNDQCWVDTEIEKTPAYATEIIETTEQVGLKLACELDKSGVVPVDAETIQMEVFSFDNQSFEINQLSFPSKQLSGNQFAEIKFPTGVKLEAAALASLCGGRPSGLGTIIRKISSYMDPVDENLNIVSDLVSFSFGDSVSEVNVQVSLAHSSALKRRGDVAQCVYWDTINAVWNTSGCVYDPIASTRRKTVCHCSHLTNFAILMDINGREEDDQVKSILTLICLTASVISLILTIFFLITLPPVKNTPITNKRVTITTNLCICLLASNFILMFGVEHTESILWCRIISATLFYCLAATFTWMLLEGYLLYQMIVVVPLNFEFRSRWLYLIGYGLAFIWLGITIAVLGTHSLYDDTSYYCWISNPLYPSRIWFFAGPVAIIIASNMIIYGKSIQIALLSNLKKKSWAARGAGTDQKSVDSQLVRRWLKGSCSLLILLGLTWLIGFLYFNEFSSWLSYVFIVVNASQGVFIFIFEIVTNSKARPAIIRMVSGKFPSTQISSVSKTSSSNPLSSLSTRSSRLFNQNSLHAKESSKGTSISPPNAITERKKANNDTKPVVMELNKY